MPENTSPETLIYFSAPIGPESCESLIEKVSAAVKHGRKEIHLLMNSGGGNVNDGIALYYTLRAFPLRLIAYNMNVVGSMAVVVFLAADERYAMRNSTFFVHETTMTERNEWQLRTAHDLVEGITENEQRMNAIVAERTAKDPAVVKRWFAKTTRFDPDAALDAGLIHDVGELEIRENHEIDFVVG